DVDELLAEVDAVAIALPPGVQAPLAVRAAEAGKHLLPEQPIALDVAGALCDIGPHARSVLVPALGPVVSVQAGAGLRDTVHLVLTHESEVASTVTLSHTVAPLSAGT